MKENFDLTLVNDLKFYVMVIHFDIIAAHYDKDIFQTFLINLQTIQRHYTEHRLQYIS